MKHSNKKLLAAIALVAATLCISSADARRASQAGAQQNGHAIFRYVAEADSFDAEVKAGKIVGMTAVKKDGTRIVLQQQSKPTCSTGCPSGQVLKCWEDHDLQMSICVCEGGGGGGGGFGGGFGGGKVAVSDMH